MMFGLAAYPLAFSGHLGMGGFTQVLDFALQVGQPRFDTGRIRRTLLLDLGRLSERTLDLIGLLSKQWRHILADQVPNSNGENREIGPFPPNPLVASFGFVGVGRSRRFLRQRVGRESQTECNG